MKQRTRAKFYDILFGDISNSLEGRIDQLFNTRGQEKLKAAVDNAIKDVKRIKKKRFTCIWYFEPFPSHRPRANTTAGYVKIYVPLARETKEAFTKFWEENYPNTPPIGTPMKFNAKVYVKTPDSYNRLNKILAELGILRPWGRTGDLDNITKTIWDCGIGTMIVDDGLIEEMHCEKFYSIKPRVEYDITYDERFPKGMEPIKKEDD